MSQNHQETTAAISFLTERSLSLGESLARHLLHQIFAIAVPQSPDDLFDPGDRIGIHAQLIEIQPEQYGNDRAAHPPSLRR